MRFNRYLVLLAILPILTGCLAKAALDVATAPVRVVSKAVDLATTSQSESDEKRGRDLRRREAEIGKLDRRYRKLLEQCERGDGDACQDADDTYAQITELLPDMTAPRRPR